MRNVPPQAAMIAAVGILGAGAAWAGSMFMSDPEPSSVQPQQIRELAAKIQSAPSQAPTLVVPASTAVVRPQVVVPETPKKKIDLVVTQVVPRVPIVQPQIKKQDRPVPPAAPEDPVKNLALMGVTHEANTDRAWLVDLASKEKETVAVGGSAFGFTVKKISGETVTLSRGPSEYTLRLGEKQLPVIVASTSGDGSGGGDDGDDGNPFGRGGRDGRDGRNPFGGPGGPGGFDFRSRFAGGFPGFSGFGGGSSGFSGRSWGGGDSSRFSSSGDSGRGGGDSSRWSSNSGRSSFGGGGSSWGGGGFGGGGFGGGGFGGGGWSGSSGRSSQTGFAGATATSNPQTSRRNGARLTGGVSSAQETPAAITNPQTQRRNGSSSGQAFGQENQNNRNSNNNQNNRLGYGR